MSTDETREAEARAREKRLRELAAAATPGPWQSMRDGNQYVGTRYMPTAKCVGASRVDGLPRPWNPHAMLAHGLKAEGHEVSRFLDADADYIEAVQPSNIVALLAEAARLRTEVAALTAERDEAREARDIAHRANLRHQDKIRRLLSDLEAAYAGRGSK